MGEDDQQDHAPQKSVSESSLADHRIQSKVQEFSQHELFRQRVLSIVKEYSDNRDFVGKVKEYAGEEYEQRVMKSARFWSSTILTAAITSIVSVGVTLLIGRALG